MSLKITQQAAHRIKMLLVSEQENTFMRISILSGGCSGFQYNITFDRVKTPDDLTFEENGALVVIDDVSLSLLNGGILDFLEDMVASKFVITNPNASSGCGCGNSFAL